MFFKLSNGLVLNLGHIKVIPEMPDYSSKVKEVALIMSDGLTFGVSRKDALQIRDIVLFEPYNYRKSC